MKYFTGLARAWSKLWRSTASGAAQPRRRSYRPELEVLEDRLALCNVGLVNAQSSARPLLQAGALLQVVPSAAVVERLSPWLGLLDSKPGSIIPTPYRRRIHIAPRLQWNQNFGYCGETSFISAGMYFGQYTSQFTARRIASPGVPQWKANSQLLIGVNDLAAARRMRLRAIEFDSQAQTSVPQFLGWVKRMFLRGHVVIIGVYNNVTILGEKPPGDPQYDHIVPVLEIGSLLPLTGFWAKTYFPTDVLTISDNGLYTPGNPPRYPFLFSYPFWSFPRSRAAANAPHGPVYSLRHTPPNFGVAITGVRDPFKQTIPVRLTSNRNHEASYPGRPPIPIVLTATVTIPDPSRSYRLYRYRRFADVPVAHFNAFAHKAVQSWTIPPNSGKTFVVKVSAWSNETVIFRAVKG